MQKDIHGEYADVDMEREVVIGNMEELSHLLIPFLDHEGRLTAFPVKTKKKLLALWYLAGKFEVTHSYSEREVNTLLNAWTTFHDPATLRRELYNKRLIDRTTNGMLYWRTEEVTTLEAFVAQYI